MRLELLELIVQLAGQLVLAPVLIEGGDGISEEEDDGRPDDEDDAQSGDDQPQPVRVAPSALTGSAGYRSFIRARDSSSSWVFVGHSAIVPCRSFFATRERARHFACEGISRTTRPLQSADSAARSAGKRLGYPNHLLCYQRAREFSRIPRRG